MQHLPISEPNNMVADTLQLVGAAGVVFSLSGFIVHLAVHLHNQVMLGANEVYNEGTNGMLAPKLGIVQLSIS